MAVRSMRWGSKVPPTQVRYWSCCSCRGSARAARICSYPWPPPTSSGGQAFSPSRQRTVGYGGQLFFKQDDVVPAIAKVVEIVKAAGVRSERLLQYDAALIQLSQLLGPLW